MEEKIKEVLDTIRPFLVDDGGNVEFVKFEDSICYVKFLGACAHCPMIEMTLHDGVEKALIESIPEIKEVQII